ncbi:MAG: HAMP domain-containing sensor histidine kinase [Planctomycetaceae bacterium]
MIALTGVIPSPRLGGRKEREIAKAHPELRVSMETFAKSRDTIVSAIKHLAVLEQDAITRYSVALHEIRKLNRTVKQTAERLCRTSSPNDPDNAKPAYVQIWKTSEIMSCQFDIIELLANENLTTLPLKSPIEIYRIFDKCIRIFRPDGDQNRILLRSSNGYSPRILACDKTFSIVPTVLIENALKYSVPDAPVLVDLDRSGTNCVITVNNTASLNESLDNSIFDRGIRATTDIEGSGYGLYLAKIVTEQHGGTIRFATSNKTATTMQCTFVVSFPELKD